MGAVANALAAATNDAQVVYGSYWLGGSVERSTNGGATWRSAGLKSESVTAFAFGPPNTVYAATLLDGVFKNGDAGANWRSVGLKGKDLWALAVARSGRVLYAGDSDGGVYRLQIGG
jgi:hypothetical protein